MAPLPFPQLHLDAFRGLHGLHLDDCGPVNLLVGPNNSGKTSALEALVLLSAPVDPTQWENAVELRTTWPLADVRYRWGGAGRLDSLEWLFPRRGRVFSQIDISGGGPIGKITATVERIEGEPPEMPIIGPTEVIEGSHPMRLRGREKPEGEQLLEPGLVIEVALHPTDHASTLFPDLFNHFRMVRWQTGRILRVRNRVLGPATKIAFATPFSHRSDGYLATLFGRIVRAGKRDQVIHLLQHLDPRVQEALILTPEEGNPQAPVPSPGPGSSLHLDCGEAGIFPIHTMGDGLRRALHFAGLVADVGKGGVLLVDEIDVGFHASVLRETFGWLCAACKEARVQVFATTHSLEAVDAVLATVPSEDLVLYRFRDGQARRYDGDRLHFARVELGHEVR
jgi:hypothetical protein